MRIQRMGVDPSDVKDDEQSVAEIAKEGLRQSLQQVHDSDESESESSSSDESHHEAETNRDTGDEDGFYGLSDIVIPSTDTEEFVEASGRLSDVLHENVKIQGPLSKRQTKRLSRFLDNIRSEFIQAWFRGEDDEVCFRGFESRLEYNRDRACAHEENLSRKATTPRAKASGSRSGMESPWTQAAQCLLSPVICANGSSSKHRKARREGKSSSQPQAKGSRTRDSALSSSRPTMANEGG